MADSYLLGGKKVSGFSRNAKDIDFDPTGTDLTSTDAESAIKEVNSKLTDIKIYHEQGSVTSGTTYTYDITNEYPAITSDNLKSISMSCVRGNTSVDVAPQFDITSAKHVVARYDCKTTQTGAYYYVFIRYKK